MLFKIGKKVYSGDKTPCALIMADDEERLKIIEILQNMPPLQGAQRWLISSPKDSMTKEEVSDWSVLSEKDLEKLNKIKVDNSYSLEECIFGDNEIVDKIC